MNKLLNELMKEGAYKANSLVISLILISVGMVMIADHRGMSIQDIQFFNPIGIMFLISGTACLILELYLLNETQKEST